MSQGNKDFPYHHISNSENLFKEYIRYHNYI